MFSALVGSPSPKVEVSVIHEVAIVAPPNLDDASISGVVTVRNPTPRKALRLYVTLEGESQLLGNGRWPAEDTIFRRRVELPLNAEELEIGDQVFAFKIDIPPTAVISQWTDYGKVFYSVTALLELSPKSSVVSRAVRVFVVATSFSGDYPPTFEMAHEHVSEDFGPVRIQLFSPNLAVSSLVHRRIFLPSTSSPIHLESVRLSLTQSTTINFIDLARPRSPEPSTHPLLFLDTNLTKIVSSNSKLLGVEVQPGHQCEETAVFRLPGERQLYASAVVGAVGKFQATHELCVELRYLGGPRKVLKSFAMRLPVSVGHLRSSFLPEYSTKPSDTRIKRTKEATFCLCEYSLAEIFPLYKDALKVGGERQSEGPHARGPGDFEGTERVRQVKTAAVQQV